VSCGSGTNWTTSLFSKDGGYIVLIKDKIRTAEGVQTGDPVTVSDPRHGIGNRGDGPPRTGSDGRTDVLDLDRNHGGEFMGIQQPAAA
jgi:hypothetical protein